MAEFEAQHQKKTISSKHFYDEDSWKTPTSIQRAWFASGCTTLLISIAKSLILISRQSTGFRSWNDPIFAAVMGYVLGDLGSGIYHWAIDNYGSARTPVFGSQIDGFLRHHDHPSEITKRHIATNLYVGAAGFTIAVLPMNIFCTNPNSLTFAAAFLGCGMFCQLLHAWSHTPKGKLPLLVVALQDSGVILPRAEHAAHHHPCFHSKANCCTPTIPLLIIALLCNSWGSNRDLSSDTNCRIKRLLLLPKAIAGGNGATLIF